MSNIPDTISTIEGNVLIAEFMGITHLEHGWTAIEKRRYAYNNSHFPDQLKYRKSWDWLMPVAKKCIESYSDNRQDIFEALHKADIEYLWRSCIEFIQWYNNKKQ